MFFEEHLEALRRERFSLPALMRYGREVAARVRVDWDANPVAVRSVWSLALFYFAADFVLSAGLALTFGPRFAIDLFLAVGVGILIPFAIVSCATSLLRDRHGFRLSALNVPIAITLLRCAMLPAIVLFLLDRHFALALGTFVVAALSDVLDGWLARRWDQCTPLGKVLDPLVDIVFNLAIFGALWAAGLTPGWVFAAAATRYGILLVGGAYLYLFVGPVKIEPTFFGRMTGLVMSALIGLTALLHIIHRPLAERLLPLTEIALGVLMTATVVYVVVLGWYNLRFMTGRASEVRGRVVGDVRWGNGP